MCLRELDSNSDWLNEINDLNLNEMMHNLMLDHVTLMIFQRKYLSWMICYDTQATYFRIKLQENLIIIFHQMSCMIDSH